MDLHLPFVPQFAAVDRHLARCIVAGGDTAEHLPTLRALAADEGRSIVHAPAPQVVEFGVRGIVSTWALLAGRPLSLASVDIVAPPAAELAEVVRCADEIGTVFEFVHASTLELDPVDCDVLFIDTLHTYAQLKAELTRHAGGVREFIAMHDTETFGARGEDGTEPGLRAAIDEFLTAHPEWEIVHDVANCNGLVVLERVS